MDVNGGWLFLLSYPNTWSLLLLVTLIEMEWRKEGEKEMNEAIKTQFYYYRSLQLNLEGGKPPWAIKYLFLVPVNLFFFQLHSGLSSCLRHPGRWLFLLCLFYFVVFFIWFYFVITFIFHSNYIHKLPMRLREISLSSASDWGITKRLEKKLDGNYTRRLWAILNKSWRQHPTKHQLYGHLPPITKTIQVRRTRHAGHYRRRKDELISDVLLWTPTYGRAKAGRPDRTYIQQLCEDTGCSPEDLPEAMNDREKWRERVRDIRASGTTWWWWRNMKKP